MISVIIPVYNVSKYLSRCINSVRTQAHVKEILLIDDGSTDDSGILCDAYAAMEPLVKVLHKENAGLSSARNAGLDLAQGEYVAFVDSDDFLEPGAYEKLLSCAQRHEADLVCAGRSDLIGGIGDKTLGLCPETEETITGPEFVARMFTWQGVDSAAWDKLYKRSLFDGLRYPEGKICEDVPVTYRAALKANKVALLPEPVYVYYHRPGSITTAPVSQKSFHFALFSRPLEELQAPLLLMGSREDVMCRKDLEAEYQHILEILPQARYLRVWSLAHPMMLCQESGQATAFRQEYRACKRALAKELPFFLTSPLLSGKEKLHDLLLVLGLFGPAWRLTGHRRDP